MRQLIRVNNFKQNEQFTILSWRGVLVLVTKKTQRTNQLLQKNTSNKRDDQLCVNQRPNFNQRKLVP